MPTSHSPTTRRQQAQERTAQRQETASCVECERLRRRKENKKAQVKPLATPPRPPRAKPAVRQRRENIRALQADAAWERTPSNKSRKTRQAQRKTARKASATCAACEKAEREHKAKEAAKAKEARRQSAARNQTVKKSTASSTSPTRDGVMVIPKPTPGEPAPAAAPQGVQQVPAKRQPGTKSDAAARQDPLPAFRFRVQIDGLAPMAFKECRGLENTTEVFHIREGGMNSHRFSSPGHTRHGDIVLKKGVGADAELWKWRKEIQTSPGQARRNGTVSLMERGTVKKSWNFYNAWPFRYEGPSLDALAEETAMITLYLAAERIEEV